MPSLYTKIGNSSKFSMYKNERITNYHFIDLKRYVKTSTLVWARWETLGRLCLG